MQARAGSILRWALFLCCGGLAAATSLWFLVLAIDSFYPIQAGAGLPRAELGLLGQLALGAGVFGAAALFAWTGLRLVRPARDRHAAGLAAGLLTVAAGAAVLALTAPTLIHPPPPFLEGPERPRSVTSAWVGFFWAIAGVALTCGCGVLTALAGMLGRSGGSRRS